MTTLDEAFAEAECFAHIAHEFAEYAATVNAAWRELWANHCPVCHGWGTKSLWDYCDAMPAEICRRCGSAGIAPDGSYSPCRYCGWWYDDGVPVT